MKAEMMSWIVYLLIYLLTLPLIGCQPSDTCYYDVSENSLVPEPGNWFRMEKVYSKVNYCEITLHYYSDTI